MPNVLDYYEYAKLATAAYVLLENEPTLATKGTERYRSRMSLT
jgi:hypothetical protein